VNVADLVAVQRPPLEPAATTEDRLLLAQVDQAPGEFEQPGIGGLPVEP
jgi:hypothetical protein